MNVYIDAGKALNWVWFTRLVNDIAKIQPECSIDYKLTKIIDKITTSRHRVRTPIARSFLRGSTDSRTVSLCFTKNAVSHYAIPLLSAGRCRFQYKRLILKAIMPCANKEVWKRRYYQE